MTARRALACLSLAMLPGLAVCEEETIIRPTAPCSVAIGLPNGAVADLLPILEGPQWAKSDSHDAEAVVGDGADLFKTGQSASIVVRDSGGKKLHVFAQLACDPNDPRALRFTYRFTAPEATLLNCCKAVINLPVEPYIGQAVKVLEGQQIASAFPAEPLSGGHLVNATARGVAVAEGQPHGFRVELDRPCWLIVDDERSWTRSPRFSIQMCGLVSSDGTTLAAGQSVEVDGVVRFANPLKVGEAPKVEPTANLAPRGFQLDLGRPLFPRLLDAEGRQIVRLGLHLSAAGYAIQPEPQQASAETPGLAGKLWASPMREKGFDVVQTTATTPGEVTVVTTLTAPQPFEHWGLASALRLSRRQFEGSEVRFLGAVVSSSVVLPAASDEAAMAKALTDENPSLGNARASGVCLESGGAPIMEFVSDQPRYWDVRLLDLENFVIYEWLVGGAPGMNRPIQVTAGSTLTHKLTCRWGIR